MTKQQAITKALNFARAEIGTKEGPNNWNKYAENLKKFHNLFWAGHKQNQMWCATFTTDIMIECFGLDDAMILLCVPEMPNGLAACKYGAQYFREAGQWRTTPEPGDIIFYGPAGNEKHQGIVEAVSGGVVTTIEGNYSDCVCRRQHRIGDPEITGYGRPKWDEVADESEQEPTPTEPTTPEPEARPPFTIALPTLKRGDVGNAVKAAQILLIGYGHYCGGRIVNKKEIPDGDFGASTENAVKIFQAQNRIETDGIIGQKTMQKMLGM